MELSIDPADDLLGNEMRERPYRPLREIHGIAQFVNLRDMGRHRHEIGLSQCLELARLRGNALQRTRHPAAEHPDDRNEGRADNDRENRVPLNWSLRTFWTKSSWAASSNMLPLYRFAERELRQPEQVSPVPRHH